MSVIITRAVSGPLLDAALRIRMIVFVEEQKYAPETELDDLDYVPSTIHLLATVPLSHPSVANTKGRLPVVDGERVAIGTCRAMMVVDDKAGGGAWGKIGRVAVVEEARGLGVGRDLMVAAEKVVKDENGCGRFKLHAQVPKKGFYEKLAYRTKGEEFDEDGTPHVLMVKGG
ncbi:hypothetical protein HK101_008411 [Irineochytrium annulatum]|nr:hypothetical protein HK101_008411 [Irineochytrium annulatum]